MPGDKTGDDKRPSPLSFARLHTALKPKTRGRNTENIPIQVSQDNAPPVIDSVVSDRATVTVEPVRIPEFKRSESWITKDEVSGFKRGDTEWEYIPHDTPLKGKAKPRRKDSMLSLSTPIEIQGSDDMTPVVADPFRTPSPSSVEDPLTRHLSAGRMMSASGLLATDANPDAPATDLTGETGETGPMPVDPYGDREATEKRYKTAVENLEAALKLPRKNWKTFEIPDFKNVVNVNDPISGLREGIKKTLDARAEAITDKTLSAKSERWIEGIFTAISPFA